MKKIFLLTAAAMMSAAMYADLQVADFENIELAEESVLHLNASGVIQSGSFGFKQEVADYGESGVYYFGNIVSNKKGNTYDYYADSDKSAKGGAFEGNNFVVWTYSYTAQDHVQLLNQAVVPGMYVCNTAWVVDAILNGDGMSSDQGAPFGESDWFKLTVHGYLNGAEVNNQVEFYLAQGTSYISEWTYVNLSSLGEVDEISFVLSSSKYNDYGMTTPAYFCIDNFGAAAPVEAIENTNAAVKAVKVIRDGKVVILRGEKAFNILGSEL